MRTEKKRTESSTKTGKAVFKPVQNALTFAKSLPDRAADLSVEKTFEKAFIQAKEVAVTQVERIRERNPQITQEELIKKLERRYISEVTSSGTVTGAAAAVPGVGTLAALGMTMGGAGVFLTSTIVYVYAMLETVNAQLEDIDHERALVLTILAGGSASQTVNKIAKRVGVHWSNKLLQKIPGDSLRAINRLLGRNFVTKVGTKQGIVVLGKVIPFGIGAAVGGSLSFAMGHGMIKATRATLVDMFENVEGKEETIEYLSQAKLPETPEYSEDAQPEDA